MESLRERAQLVTKSYNAIEGISLQEVQGAMYAFPRVTLPENAIKIARVYTVGYDRLTSQACLGKWIRARFLLR